jgi:putative transposase
MKRSKFSDEHVAYALRQTEGGTAVADVCRQLGISEATPAEGLPVGAGHTRTGGPRCGVSWLGRPSLSRRTPRIRRDCAAPCSPRALGRATAACALHRISSLCARREARRRHGASAAGRCLEATALRDAAQLGQRPGISVMVRSILITSAPRSASISEHTDPCCQIVRSSTRIPSSGICMAAAPRYSGNTALQVTANAFTRSPITSVSGRDE